ncbi:protein spaetzle isoform X2 [Bicyclus anynana]|uniref:Protein spaetzle isoform X2 n=1 Tax=Bicyclus anynana TaxID=110368 RepID=A0ABM3LNP9_BICAN|nr:protein spaetzle isoform X2 [Bicyclus anynana]
MLNFQIYNSLFYIVLILIQIYEIDSNDSAQKSKWISNPHSLNSKDKILLSIEPNRNLALTIPEECEELGICESVPDYPHKIISRIIKQVLERNITFHMDVDPNDSYMYVTDESFEIYEEEELCTSKPKLYYPQAARDANKKWHLILNSVEISQNFIGEHCALKYSSCNKVAFFTNSYHGVCVQKYMQRIMYGINEEFTGVIKTLFDVPSCCSCIARISY